MGEYPDSPPTSSEGEDAPIGALWPEGLLDPNEMPAEVTDDSEDMVPEDEHLDLHAHNAHFDLVERLRSGTYPDMPGVDYQVNKFGRSWLEAFFFDTNTVILCHRPEMFEIHVVQGVTELTDEDKELIMQDSHGIGWKVSKVFCHSCQQLKDLSQMSASGKWLAYRGLKMSKRIRGHAQEPKIDDLRPMLCEQCLTKGGLAWNDMSYLRELANRKVVKVEIKSKVIIRLPGTGRQFCEVEREPVEIISEDYGRLYRKSMRDAADRLRGLLSVGARWSLPIADSPASSSEGEALGEPPEMASSISSDDTL